MLGLKLNHVSKRGHRSQNIAWKIHQIYCRKRLLGLNSIRTPCHTSNNIRFASVQISNNFPSKLKIGIFITVLFSLTSSDYDHLIRENTEDMGPGCLCQLTSWWSKEISWRHYFGQIFIRGLKTKCSPIKSFPPTETTIFSHPVC